MSEEQQATPAASPDELEKAARRFDIRRIIGGLFVVYGVIVTVMGVIVSDADIEKAAGVNINLWSGLVMLATGLIFLFWERLSPVRDVAPRRDDELPPAD